MGLFDDTLGAAKGTGGAKRQTSGVCGQTAEDLTDATKQVINGEKNSRRQIANTKSCLLSGNVAEK